MNGSISDYSLLPYCLTPLLPYPDVDLIEPWLYLSGNKGGQCP